MDVYFDVSSSGLGARRTCSAAIEIRYSEKVMSAATASRHRAAFRARGNRTLTLSRRIFRFTLKPQSSTHEFTSAQLLQLCRIQAVLTVKEVE